MAKLWQHEDTGYICESETRPSSRYHEIKPPKFKRISSLVTGTRQIGQPAQDRKQGKPVNEKDTHHG